MPTFTLASVLFQRYNADVNFAIEKLRLNKKPRPMETRLKPIIITSDVLRLTHTIFLSLDSSLQKLIKAKTQSENGNLAHL